MDGKRTVLIASLVLAAVAVLSWDQVYIPPEVRVKVEELRDQAVISGRELKWKAGKKEGAGETYRLELKGREVKVGKAKLSPPILFEARGPISVAGTAYRGRILIAPGSPPLIINLVDVESYVAGVINHEIDSRWPGEAVEAMCILIRTYALKKREERKKEAFDLDRTTTDQVYGGQSAEDDLSLAAVTRTRGQVMAYGGRLAVGLYHACCGGQTELPSEVWGGRDLPYQRSVMCRYCEEAPRFFWRWPDAGGLNGRELATVLALPAEVERVEIAEKTAGQRAKRIEVRAGGKVYSYTGNEFRARVGFSRLFSTAFRVDVEQGGFVFRGSGAGHGVGLCQWGARGMALLGYSKGEILAWYFPGAAVEIYDRLNTPAKE